MTTKMIIKGDCIEEMKKLPDNSVDAVITDPPYHLMSIVKRFGNSKAHNTPAMETKEGGVWARKAGGFMGKTWDGVGGDGIPIAYNVKLWKECLRVVKPGGFLLAFGGTRTYHRMASGVEDAGFEIRDCIQWLYGSGFPKSLNIGKQVDKMQGNEREVLEPHGRYKHSFKDHKGKFVNTRDADGNKRINVKLTKGNSEWEGWGTALKPAVEPIVVARKPLSEKNVALNVLKWGTGGINIDACRIGNGDGRIKGGNGGMKTKYVGGELKNKVERAIGGRFPANIILDEEAGRLLDEQSGKCKTGDINNNLVGFKKGCLYGNSKMVIRNYKTDKPTGASRFFYCAKASKSERNLGCEDMEDKKTDDGREVISDRLHQRGATDRKNNHPTVKPIKLMEYLIKLVSKEGATILDPFLGSGTTAIACIKQGRKFIGIEKEKEYVKIAEARINKVKEQKTLIQPIMLNNNKKEKNNGKK